MRIINEHRKKKKKNHKERKKERNKAAFSVRLNMFASCVGNVPVS